MNSIFFRRKKAQKNSLRNNFMTFKPLRTDQRIIRFGLAIILFVVLLVAIFVNPEIYPISNCFIHNATGYSCPSCGLSRSFHAGANLHLLQSFGFHAMGPILLLGTTLLFIKLSFESVSGKSIQLHIKSRVMKISMVIVGLIWAADWIYRLIIEIGQQ